MYEDPTQAAEFRESFEIHNQLGELMADQLQKDANGDPQAMFMALESVLRSVVKDMGSPKGIGEFARFLRDNPDKFSMFSTVTHSVPSNEQLRRCKATLRRFVFEKRELAHTDTTIFGAFGALNLADDIENWDPEHQARLQQVGLRSSYELDDDEGRVFVAYAPPRTLMVMGRRDPRNGDLCVSRYTWKPPEIPWEHVESPDAPFERIIGPEAERLLDAVERLIASQQN